MESVTSFFFNIVPGALLIFILEKYSKFKVISEVLTLNDSKIENVLFWLIIFAIFIGFFLQALTKLVKENILYQIIWCEVKNEDPENFKKAKEIFEQKDLLVKTDISKKETEKMFFTMDNYLSLSGAGRLLPHFASRLAYWSNIFWISLIIVILSSLNIIENIIIIQLSWLILFVSSYESWIHLKNHYDIVLRSFVAKINIDKDDSLKLVRINQRKRKII